MVKGNKEKKIFATLKLPVIARCKHLCERNKHKFYKSDLILSERKMIDLLKFLLSGVYKRYHQ